MRRAIIIGASGGIGAAFVDVLAGRCEHVFALSRKALTSHQDNITALQMDFLDEAQVKATAKSLREQGPFDLILVATGFLHNDTIGPEKSLSAITRETLETNMAINMMGPTLVMKHFLRLLPRGERGVFGVLSARVGSIEDNRLGGWYGYRASKAALNMALKTAAIEHTRKQKEHILLALHPGTVDTGLSKPFQANVPDGKLFTPEQSVGYLLDVIDKATPEMSGKLVAWDGAIVPY